MRSTSCSKVWVWPAAVLWTFLVALPAFADWDWSAEASVETTRNSNVFNLDRVGKERVDAQSPAHVANGRLDGMESVDDLFVSPRLAFSGRTDTGLGRLRVTPWVGYERYLENDEKSHAEIGIELRQTLRERAAIDLKLSYEFDVFKKNYLAGTTMLGQVMQSDRIYQQGEYDELEIEAGYEHRLWRGKKARRVLPFLGRGMGRVSVGYADRSFDRFSNRDLDTLELGLSLETHIAESHRVELGYTFSFVDAPGGSELVIVDEFAAGVDLNGDLDSLDANIALPARVDRSRRDHALELRWKWQVTSTIRLKAGFTYRILDYRSNEPLDFAYNDREDDDQEVSLGVRWDIADRWTVDLEGEYGTRKSNKDAFLLLDDDGANKRQAIVRFDVRRAF